MTDNTKQSGFWTTAPGILTGIAGVLGGLLAIIKVFHPDGVSPSTASNQNQTTIKSGSIAPFMDN